MTDLLIAFVIPILIVIISGILQTILKCPFKVAGLIFVSAIITALALGGTLTLFAIAWFYTALAFVIAYAVGRFFKWGSDNNTENNNSNNNSGNNGNNCNNNSSNRCCRCLRG